MNFSAQTLRKDTTRCVEHCELLNLVSHQQSERELCVLDFHDASLFQFPSVF